MNSPIPEDLFKEEQMLVLTRKEQERIVIGDDIEVVVLSIHGQRVKLGIEAARDIRIHRAEVIATLPVRLAAVGCVAD